MLKPILEQKDKLPRFFGSLCQDIQLTDDAKFFNKDIETKRFIFASDAQFEEATKEKQLLDLGIIKNQYRESIILDSKFYQDLNNNLLDSSNAFSDQGKFSIQELRLGSDQARLFNSEYVQWGVMKMQNSLEANSD